MDTTHPHFTHRNDESTRKQFIRCDRFYHNKNFWFFRTREGVDYGPYISQVECKYAYEEFLEVVSDQKSLGSIAIDFKDTESNWKVPHIDFNQALSNIVQ